MRTKNQRRETPNHADQAGRLGLSWFDTLPLPCRLDRLADAELQHGHVLAAERLAQRAAEMRAVVR